ncbi:hypothetical protein HID58_040730 [Brassica napus]|uniref:Uncharacterized protein n=1 Tax=Brassica napus TaxID=3708 RepID=A0ABQ8B8V4_BRANA|nr:hypothetical protein HID58_040730 [Brassica napus]
MYECEKLRLASNQLLQNTSKGKQLEPQTPLFSFVFNLHQLKLQGLQVIIRKRELSILFGHKPKIQHISKLNKIGLQPKMTANSKRCLNASRELSRQRRTAVQTSSTRDTEILSVASSGPVETAPQDSKPMGNLKQTLGNEAEESSLSIGKGNGGEVFSSEEEGGRDSNGSDAINENTTEIFRTLLMGMAQTIESCLSTSDQARQDVARRRCWRRRDKRQSLLRGCPRRNLSDLVGESVDPHEQGGPFRWRLRQ